MSIMAQLEGSGIEDVVTSTATVSSPTHLAFVLEKETRRGLTPRIYLGRLHHAPDVEGFRAMEEPFRLEPDSKA